ncbi:Transcriptional regulator containing an AAA-type ATPase domain and a DNA-binding domain [Dethiosulfatibacter aminovorans DSM 17477]|uniref:Transcriptional regulator containing an AAA-type ATPase domain and a DNA-binding domain n=1 Tax=Dethiosulfatibacter aminovorans DSM 17477 TaxID=1121476 RepID=A0A1M6C6P2_9FIRM|nr:sigma-54-dependent Fis family transcriptional regulator [Dethiosulfatibacter aminovorans]SHI56378.1 Transcriptional regulator containing an AAA-type ATPase domain and a DNA-binding domain [Dethiosulfatibacter aminovorans DSM 17477]
MKKIRILGIAPYEGMKTMMQNLAAKRKDIDLTVYIGDLDKGVEIARKNVDKNFDVIISRGGTASMIEKITDIPLVRISLSVYDIIRAIKMAENYTGKYAIVGYPGITETAKLLCDLLQYDIDIYTINSVDEVSGLLSDLKKKGYQMILCDMIANTTAKRLGMNAILITSGDESINIAFDQASRLYKSYFAIKENNLFLEKVMGEYDEKVMVYDKTGQLKLSTVDRDNLEAYTKIAEKELEASFKTNNRKFIKRMGEFSISVTSKVSSISNSTYVVYCFNENHNLQSSNRFGISYLTKDEVDASFFNSFYSIASPLSEMENDIRQMSTVDSPIMILGETGTGKSQIAKLLYARSSLNNNPLITLDCNLMDDKTWFFLLNHYNSPLTDSDNTLYFMDIHKLPEDRKDYLLTTLVSTNVHKRNRLLMSCATNESGGNHISAKEYINQLTCMTIHLAPLRERTGDIPQMSSLYINALNLDLAKQIIGFVPEAMELMKNYNWPANFTQFKRVLREMVTVTTTPYIPTETVESILEKEKLTAAAASIISPENEDLLSFPLDTTMTLNEISREIISLYIEKAGGNQSLAAKRLGISRTTLWRYLK